MALAITIATPASAEPTPTERALAQTLFDEGRKLMTEKHYAEACAKFAKSQELDPSAGTFINLALCHESEGKLATAWAEFNEALSQALRDGRSDREQAAREHIEKLKPKLNQLTIAVSDAAKVKGFQVTLDGAPLREALWGVATPIDPGKHMVVATAPNKQTYSTSVSFEEPGVARTVELPPLQSQAAPAPVEKGKRGCACDVTDAPSTVDPSLFAVALWTLARRRRKKAASAGTFP
jgi:hypothetical protein